MLGNHPRNAVAGATGKMPTMEVAPRQLEVLENCRRIEDLVKRNLPPNMAWKLMVMEEILTATRRRYSLQTTKGRSKKIGII